MGKVAEGGSYIKCAVLGYFFFPYALFVLLSARTKDKDKRLGFHAAQSFFLWIFGILLTLILGRTLRLLGELAAFLTITGAVYAVIKLLREEDPRLPLVSSLADKMVNKE